MEGLMFICRNWGDADCHPNVRKWTHLKEPRNSGETPVWPAGEELAGSDEICKKCEFRFFEIEKRQCPLCSGNEFSEVRGFVISDKDAKKFENYYLKCKQCGTPSILRKPDP